MGAFAPLRQTDTANVDSEDIPFLKLLHSPSEMTTDTNANAHAGGQNQGDDDASEKNDGDITRSSGSGCSSKSATSQVSGQEEFVMVELVGILDAC